MMDLMRPNVSLLHCLRFKMTAKLLEVMEMDLTNISQEMKMETRFCSQKGGGGRQEEKIPKHLPLLHKQCIRNANDVVIKI